MSRHPGIRHFGFTQCHPAKHQPGVKKLDKGPPNANFSSLLGLDNRGQLHFRAGHGDPLGHYGDRPDQANRDYDGDNDPCVHLHPLCVAFSLAK